MDTTSMKVNGLMVKDVVSVLASPNILGNGRFSMKDGSIYEGSFIDGEMCGNGRRFYALSKNEYIGHFLFGERHGYGLMKYGDGSTYEGDWYHNLQQGNNSFLKN